MLDGSSLKSYAQVSLNEDQDITIEHESGSQASAGVQNPEHGLTYSGETASCGIDSVGVIDCDCCLTQAFSELATSLPEEDRATSQSITDAVIAAGALGLTRSELSVSRFLFLMSARGGS